MNLAETLAAQHAAYERDLEPDNYGMDDCPFDTANVWDFDNDITTTVPCAYCGYTDCDSCIDTGSPFAHLNARRGW